MASWTVRGVRLKGAVAALPPEVRTVADLGEGVFSAEELARTAKAIGLGTLHRVIGDVTANDLCVAAAERLLRELDWAPETVAGVIAVTQTPDRLLPGNASYAHGRLGLTSGAFAFDIALGCSGFTYAFAVAAKMMGPGCGRILLLAGDTLSRVVDPTDKATCLLFGDAGTATGLEWEGDGSASATFVLGADGSGADALKVDGIGFRAASRALAPADPARDGTLSMDGIAVFNFTMREVPRALLDVCDAHGWTIDRPELVLLHQANAMITTMISKRIGQPVAKFPTNIGRFGNTSVASLPLLLADREAVALAGREVPILMAGFGVGLSWGAVACELPAGFVQGLMVLGEAT